jgi:hypothetical protein
MDMYSSGVERYCPFLEPCQIPKPTPTHDLLVLPWSFHAGVVIVELIVPGSIRLEQNGWGLAKYWF